MTDAAGKQHSAIFDEALPGIAAGFRTNRTSESSCWLNSISCTQVAACGQRHGGWDMRSRQPA
jgi:hypothetical protein